MKPRGIIVHLLSDANIVLFSKMQKCFLIFCVAFLLRGAIILWRVVDVF
jgi:hypothetical protein